MLTGIITQVVHHHPRTGYAVLVVQVDRREIRVVGEVFGRLSPGDRVVAEGYHAADIRWGDQFNATKLEMVPPTTAETIELYLASGAVSGIGPALARRMVLEFGDQTLDVIKSDARRLRAIPGLGWTKIEALQAAMADNARLSSVVLSFRLECFPGAWRGTRGEVLVVTGGGI